MIQKCINAEVIFLNILYTLIFSLFLIILRERERKNQQGRGRERGGQRIRSGLHVDSREPDVGLEPMNHEIMI